METEPIHLRADDEGRADEAPELDPIPEGQSGDFAIMHRTLPAGQALRFADGVVRFEEDRAFTILHRNGITWMSDTPQETVAMAAAARRARGRTLCVGLGLGVFMRLATEAESIDCIELSPDVKALVWKHIAGPNRRLIEGDAATVMLEMVEAGVRYDFIYIDVWDSGDYEHLPWVNWYVRTARRMLTPNGEIMAWVHERAVRSFVKDALALWPTLRGLYPLPPDKLEGTAAQWPLMGRLIRWWHDLSNNKRRSRKGFLAEAERLARTVTEPPEHMEQASKRREARYMVEKMFPAVVAGANRKEG